MQIFLQKHGAQTGFSILGLFAEYNLPPSQNIIFSAFQWTPHISPSYGMTFLQFEGQY